VVKTDRIVEFLNAVGVSNANKHKRTGWVVSRCPLGPWKHEGGVSSPEVFGIKCESHDPHANCFACGWHGTAGDLVQQLKGLQKMNPLGNLHLKQAQALVLEAENELELDLDFPGIEELLQQKNELHVFPEWWLDGFPPATDVQIAVDYLVKRSVSWTTADELDLRWDPIELRVCFPVRDFKQRLVGLHGRAIQADTNPRYRMYLQMKKNNPICWLGESWVDLNKPIVVVEGPFDLVSVRRVYKNVVSPLFANPSFAKLKRMSDCLEWITCFDRGAGGDSGRERVTKALGHDHVVTHLHPPKGRKDPGDCSREEILQLLSNFVQLTAQIPCNVAA
jgi:hypothetical protein